MGTIHTTGMGMTIEKEELKIPRISRAKLDEAIESLSSIGLTEESAKMINDSAHPDSANSESKDSNR